MRPLVQEPSIGALISSQRLRRNDGHAAFRNIVFADLDGYFSHTFDPIVDGMAVKNGMITLPEKPGLGTDIDPAFLKKLKRA